MIIIKIASTGITNYHKLLQIIIYPFSIYDKNYLVIEVMNE